MIEEAMCGDDDVNDDVILRIKAKYWGAKDPNPPAPCQRTPSPWCKSSPFKKQFFTYGQSSYFGTNALHKWLSKWPNVIKYFEIFGLLWQMNSQWWFWTQKISDLDMFNTCFSAKHSFLRVIFGVALHPVLWDNQPFTTTAHRCSFFPPFSVLPHKASVESVSYFASTVHVT